MAERKESGAQVSLEEFQALQTQLETERQARALAAAEAEQARSHAMQLAEELAERDRNPHPQMVEGAMLTPLDTRALRVGESMLDDMHLLTAIRQVLSQQGVVYQDHRQTRERGPDGMETLRWRGYERPLLPTDIIGVADGEDGGYTVVTADGRKYRNVMV